MYACGFGVAMEAVTSASMHERVFSLASFGTHAAFEVYCIFNCWMTSSGSVHVASSLMFWIDSNASDLDGPPVHPTISADAKQRARSRSIERATDAHHSAAVRR